MKDLARYPVKEIFAGSVHTCALLEDGRIFSWGKCEYTGHGLQQVGDGAFFPLPSPASSLPFPFLLCPPLAGTASMRKNNAGMVIE